MPEAVDLANHVGDIWGDAKGFGRGELGGTVFDHGVPEVEEGVGRGGRERAAGDGALETADEGFGEAGGGELGFGKGVDGPGPEVVNKVVYGVRQA